MVNNIQIKLLEKCVPAADEVKSVQVIYQWDERGVPAAGNDELMNYETIVTEIKMSTHWPEN